MRVAMMSSNHQVSDARITYKQALSLANLGHEVCVFGLEGDSWTDLPGVRLHAVAPFEIGIRARLSITPKLLGPVLRWKPDVVVGHEPETAALGLHIRSRCGAKVVFDAFEVWEAVMARRAPRPLRPAARSGFAQALRCIGRRVDWVTVVAPYTLELYRAIRPDGHVDVLHNSPRPELFPECDQDVDDPITVAHEGSLDEQRGMVKMLEAVALVRRKRPIRFLVVGFVRPWARQEFDRLVGDLGLEDVLDIPGWLPYEDVGPMMARAHIGLVAHQYTINAWRSLNNKMYNYMCCGQPVIGPEGSATADMLRKYDCGLCVDTSSSQAIADAILQLADDRPLRKRLGANGRKAILEELGWHKMEQRMERIYGRLERERRRSCCRSADGGPPADRASRPRGVNPL